jgi:acyl-CoA reductase-like NAD-dependent aldehyde dehydrogenase
MVEDNIYDRFVQAVVERTKQPTVGDGMKPGVVIGPAVSESQLNTVY